MDRDINASINILPISILRIESDYIMIEGIKNLIIEKELNPSIINTERILRMQCKKIGDLKDYLIERLNDTSKVVDEKKISDNLLRKPQH